MSDRPKLTNDALHALGQAIANAARRQRCRDDLRRMSSTMLATLSGYHQGEGGTMNIRTVISYNDLRHVCVSCSHCNTKIIFDLKAKPASKEHVALLHTTCPGCGNQYDSALRAGLQTLQETYDTLSPVEGSISFITG